MANFHRYHIKIYIYKIIHSANIDIFKLIHSLCIEK